KNSVVGRLGEVADELGCTIGQLALAWILTNPNVSTIITGASRVEQIAENMKAQDVAAQITPELKEKIEAIVGDAYQ
ncbi:aldo/keto reductase, partial [Paraburkholderia sp. SIMBA_055]